MLLNGDRMAIFNQSIPVQSPIRTPQPLFLTLPTFVFDLSFDSTFRHSHSSLVALFNRRTYLVAEGLDLAVGAVGDGRVRVPIVFVRVDLNVQRKSLRRRTDAVK